LISLGLERQWIQKLKAILNVPSPKIVIAGSGMSNGGRILHHEKNYLPDPKNTILLTGYHLWGQWAFHSRWCEKDPYNGEDVSVRAHVAFISAYSGHKDSDHLVEFVGHTAGTLKKVFVTMGEPKSAMFLSKD
jgi:metallo-beta-lactamase family protein